MISGKDLNFEDANYSTETTRRIMKSLVTYLEQYGLVSLEKREKLEQLVGEHSDGARSRSRA